MRTKPIYNKVFTFYNTTQYFIIFVKQSKSCYKCEKQMKISRITYIKFVETESSPEP